MTGKKVVLIAPVPPPYGGIANWTDLILRYAGERQEISFLTINTAIKSRGAVDGRSLWDRIVVSGFAMLKYNRSFRALIRQEKPCAVHLTTSGQLALIRDNLLLSTAKRKGVPSVYHIRFGRTAEIAEKNTLEWRMMKRAIGKADVTVAIDEKTYGALQQYCPDLKSVCIPNPVDLTRLPQQQTETNTIAFLGWVIPQKGVEELLQAWQELAPHYPAWSLRLIGPYRSDFYAAMQEKYPQLRVTWVGELFHDAAMEEVSRCGIFTLPSYTEGFPNAVVEAMALGKPIAATAVGAIPEMLSGCGEIVPPKDSAALKTALETLMNSPELRAAHGSTAQRRAQEQYALPVVFDRYLRLWNNR